MENILMASPNRTSLTQLGVERLRPKDREQILWDTVLPGFGLRISPKGVKTFLIQYRYVEAEYRDEDGKLKRRWRERQEKVGRLDTLTVAKARDRAREIKKKVSAGINPVAERNAIEAAEQAERQARELTLRKVTDRYMTEYAERNTRPSTTRITRGLLKQWCGALGDRPIGDIAKADILGFLNTKLAEKKDGTGRIAGNHLLRAIGHLFTWAQQLDLVTNNPAQGVAKPQPRMVSRDRYLDADEITSFWAACNEIGWPVGALFKLLLLTGQREGEVGQMRWTELDLPNRVWNIPGTRTKNGKPHIVHLSDLAVEIIAKLPVIYGSKYVFTMTGKGPFCNFDYAKKRIQKLMGVFDWRPHDLRRTATTVLAELGIAPHVADRILNHTGGTISGVAAIYNRFQYLEERKAALNALGQYIERLIGRNVIPLRSRTEVS
jgi:integrase